MEKMKSDTPLDYAEFQLSPKHSRCELFVSSGGNTEKLASGLLKPFVTHLKVAEEQLSSASQSIRLDVGRHKNAEAWFTKGTIDRFVRFVSTPEVLEMVNTFDTEMSQLEAARRIYSQGIEDQQTGGGGSGLTAADDATKRELLRAIDVRLEAAQQDLTNACARAAAAGFSVDTVSDLQIFADIFGAHRLNEACSKFISLCKRRQILINPSPPPQEPTTHQQPNHSATTFPLRRTFSKESIVEREDEIKPEKATGETDKEDEASAPVRAGQHKRRLSVQDRINMFENKQKENSGGKPVVKPVELRRLSSDVSTMGAAAEKAVLRRWSGVSDLSVDLTAEKKNTESPLCTSSSENKVSDVNIDTTKSSSVVKPESNVNPSLTRDSDSRSEYDFDKSEGSANSNPYLESGGSDGLKDQGVYKVKPMSFIRKSENRGTLEEKSKIGDTAFAFEDKSKWRDLQNSEDRGENRSEIAVGNNHIAKPIEDFETRDKSIAQSSLESTWKNMEESWAYEDVSASRSNEAFAVRNKEIEDDSFSTEVVEKNEATEESLPRRMKFSRKVSAAELTKKAKIQPNGNNRTRFSGKITNESQEGFDSFESTPEQFQRGRQSKGNTDRNDELKLKANELEKLFAEHKQRAPTDQQNSARKGKTDDSPKLQSNEPSGNLKNKTKSSATSSTKTIDSQNYGDALKKSFSELSVSEGSRGKLYHRYNQKRDAKLKEEWSSNRADKEAKLKSMRDSLERSKSEMKAKLSGSSRFRSYSSRSILNREQSLDFEDCEFDDDALDFQEKNHPTKKLSSNSRSFSSTTPRPSAIPVMKSAAKTSTTSAKQRMQAENPLAQSVPNFSDLRKENTKPSSGGGKVSRSRNHARSKSISEETPIVKEDKSRRLHALRKSSANPTESVDSDGVAPIPIKFDEENLKSSGTKPFLRKGSRAVRTNIVKQRVVFESEPVNDVDENDEIASERDEFENTVEDEREEDFETLNDNILDDRGKFENSGSENGDETPTFSALDQALGSHLPVDSMQNWDNGSHMPWNSRTQNPFTYVETSDIDASVDSPIGSPSWNSHSLNPMESDAARMRKKWGMCEKPMVVTHSSRKDMTRGFKRLLKFGRKNRGSESLADWVSATTSEGDDDTEDGRDIANRSSEDLRKSRMGFSQAQPSDDGFNESEFFTESVQSSQSSIPAPPANFRLREDQVSGTSIKAPRSFFSLSTFRSKGNESKTR